MSRVDQYNITVSIGSDPLGTFDKMTGGEIDSEETKYKPGGMSEQISLGGSRTVNNITVSRLFRLDRDLALVSRLKSAVGKESVKVSKQSLDRDGAPFGTPLVYQGILKQITWPEPDSESSAAAILALEISTASVV
jgi:hypothetical protein